MDRQNEHGGKKSKRNAVGTKSLHSNIRGSVRSTAEKDGGLEFDGQMKHRRKAQVDDFIKRGST